VREVGIATGFVLHEIRERRIDERAVYPLLVELARRAAGSRNAARHSIGFPPISRSVKPFGFLPA